MEVHALVMACAVMESAPALLVSLDNFAKLKVRDHDHITSLDLSLQILFMSLARLPPDDCATDNDCNNKGACLDLGSITTTPRRQCFCDRGYMGLRCEQSRSTWTSTHIRLTFLLVIHFNPSTVTK